MDKKKILMEGKSLDISKGSQEKIPDPFADVDLGSQQLAGVLTDATVGTLKSASGVIVPGLNKLFEWTERLDQASREEKLKLLLNKYAENFKSVDDALSQLKTLTVTRGGQTLFRKIIQIVDKGAEDQEWIVLLATVLQKISEAEFEKYFEAQMFILSQIDRLSPQALIILSQYNIWRKVNIQGTTTASGKTAGDWAPQVTKFMRQHLEIENLEVGGRINHSFNELESANMLTLSGHQLKLTPIGLEIHRILE
jgi:hypothetical protein